jgi:hypothetical protein
MATGCCQPYSISSLASTSSIDAHQLSKGDASSVDRKYSPEKGGEPSFASSVAFTA